MAVIPRLLGRSLLATDARVVVLEGARAVGKTTLVRGELPSYGFSYTSLADPSVLARALKDPDGWLRSLRLPAVIDEAQLLDSLPLLVKELVDEAPGGGTRIVLTGSASIGRSGLGGADPLTRRSRRFTMGPLTEWEIEGHTGSLIDILFDAEIATGERTGSDEAELVRRLTRGGFPSYVVPDVIRARQDLWRDLRSDIESLLSDEALAGRGIDSLSARSALDSLLRTPGAIFNASRLAAQLDLDRRTIDRYLSVFERVFLLHHLPNLATSVSRQNHSRAKIHPVDTSFAVESLARAGTDIPDDRGAYGAVLESHVVNQLTTAVEWSQLDVRSFYWRSAEQRGREVDLVLVDERDRTVGIEVKASRSLHDRDDAGLRALAAARGLHRGFIFYAGTETVQLRENVWGVPFSVLEGAHSLGPRPITPSREGIVLPAAPVNADASMFVSYVHADDTSSRGRILGFARDLADRYEFLTGRAIRLFIDRDDITWGENWARRLTREAESTSFLLSFVTPRYLSSEACRKEFLDFSQASRSDPDQKILLPLLWVDPSTSGVVSDQDPVWSVIRETQWELAVEARLLEPGGVAYDTLLDRVAQRLRTAVDSSSLDRAREAPTGESAPLDDRDLIEVSEALKTRQAELERSTLRFKAAMEGIGAVFSGRPPIRMSPTYATGRALAEIGKDLEDPVAELDRAAEELGRTWDEVDSDVSRLILLSASTPDDQLRRFLFETLDGLARNLEVPGAAGFEQQLHVMADLSRHLRPMSRAMTSALRLLSGVQLSARAWRDKVGSASPR